MYSHGSEFEMAPGLSMNLIALDTSSVALREEEPQTAYPCSLHGHLLHQLFGEHLTSMCSHGSEESVHISPSE